MTNTELRKMYKSELNNVLDDKALLEQMIQSVTHREFTIREALEKLGVPTPSRKGKTDPKLRKQVLVMLTR